MRKRSVFSTLNASETRLLDYSRNLLEYNKGQYIFKEGDSPRGIFCIKRGKIKVAERMAVAADAIGLEEILSGGCYNCSAYALEDSALCFIPKETYSVLVKKIQNRKSNKK